ALGQAISGIGLLLVFLVPGSMLSTGLFTFWVAFGLFFISSPQQILMVEAGKGGGELIGGAAVQVAFNLGNAVGSIVGGATLAARNDYHLPALAGVPFAVAAVVLLIVYSWRHETHTDALQRMRQIHSAEIGSTPEQA
ncbi:MAG: MFS transporter, partial [Bifidobacterium psychraerophilum]